MYDLSPSTMFCLPTILLYASWNIISTQLAPWQLHTALHSSHYLSTAPCSLLQLLTYPFRQDVKYLIESVVPEVPKFCSLYSFLQVYTASYRCLQLPAAYSSIQVYADPYSSLQLHTCLFSFLQLPTVLFSFLQLPTYKSLQLPSPFYRSLQLQPGPPQAPTAACSSLQFYTAPYSSILYYSSLQLFTDPFRSLQLYTAFYSSLQLYRAPYSPMQLHTVLYSSLQLDTAPFGFIQLPIALYSSLQLYTAPFSSIPLPTALCTSLQLPTSRVYIPELPSQHSLILNRNQIEFSPSSNFLKQITSRLSENQLEI